MLREPQLSDIVFSCHCVSPFHCLCCFVKYPGVHDYLLSVSELDDFTMMTVHSGILTTRSNYMKIHDLYAKNEEKLKDLAGINAFENMI